MKKNNNQTARSMAISRKKLLSANSPFAVREAYNLVRAKLMFTTKGEKCPIFVVTSAEASEGKTINTINMSIAFAQAGKKTLIIDADMRNPSVNKFFSIRRENGLSEILSKIQTDVTVQPLPYENLFVLTAGSIPPNPSELMSSSMFNQLLSFLSEEFDCIFIDTPPVGIVSDAALLAELVTGYVMVVRSGSSELPAVRSAVQTLINLQCNVVGFVLNDVDGKGSDYHRSSYGGYVYGYGRKPERKNNNEAN